VGRTRTDAEQQIADLLRTARRSLRLSVAFLSRLDGTTQHLEVVDSSVPFLFQEGYRQRQEVTLCQAVLDRKLPQVIPDLRDFPQAMELPAARMPRLRSYVSVPVTLSDGTLYGTFCAAGLTSDKDLTERDKVLMDVLASAAAVIIEPEVRAQERRTEITARLDPLIAEGGPVVVLQPIVDLATGRRVGAEALSRFPAEWGLAPDVCFAEAHSVGSGHVLELLALERAAEHLARVDGYVAMNVSPATLLTPDLAELLGRLPLDRVLLELSEHDPVEDYAALTRTLAPFRADGLRLAIDDVGAGFSSLRHIVVTAPDVIKIDRSIVAGVDTDPVLATLVRSLVEFGHGCDARVVAEGVEHATEAAVLRGLGVDAGQGWHFGRPGPPEALTDVAPVAVPHPRAPADVVPAGSARPAARDPAASGVGAALHGGEHGGERRTVVVRQRVQQPVQGRDVVGDRGVDHRPALVGQLDDAEPAVGRVRPAHDEAALLEPLQAVGRRGRRQHHRLGEVPRRQPEGCRRPAQRGEQVELAPVQAVPGEGRLDHPRRGEVSPGQAGEDGHGGRVDVGPLAAPLPHHLLHGVLRPVRHGKSLTSKCHRVHDFDVETTAGDDRRRTRWLHR
jgi:EAL domain-containing protein (putative c-di-GMP-specific phosphodiesterase class I)